VPVTLRAAASANDADAGTGPTVNRPTGTMPGDLLIATMVQDQDNTVAQPGNMSMPSGWTLLANRGSATLGGFVHVWWKIAASSDPTSWKISDNSTSANACDCCATIMAFTGWDSTWTPTVAWRDNAASVTFTAPGGTGVVDGLLLNVYARGDSSGAVATFSGYSGAQTAVPGATQSPSGSYTSLTAATEPTTSTTATGTRTVTSSDSSKSIAWSMVIPPGAAPADRQTIVVRDSTKARVDGTSIPATRPVGVVAGDVLYAWHVADDAPPTGAPAGWTSVFNGGVATRYMRIWRKVAGASEPSSYAFTTSATASHSLVIAALAGVDTTTPEDVAFASNNQTTASSSGTAPSVTTVTPGALLLCAWDNRAGTAATSITPPAAMTEYEDTAAQYVCLAVAGETRDAAGATGTRVATAGLSDTWFNVAFAVRPALANTTPPIAVDLPAEAAAAADQLTATPATDRPLPDTATAADTLTVPTVRAALADSGAAVEELTRGVRAPLPDTAAAADALTAAAAPTVTFTDTGTTTDQLTATVIAATKALPDTAAGVDALAATQPPLKTFADTAAAGDRLTAGVRVLLPDTATATDPFRLVPPPPIDYGDAALTFPGVADATLINVAVADATIAPHLGAATIDEY